MAIAKVGDKETFNYTGGVQTFTAPFDGIYLLEAYGAQGGNAQSWMSDTVYGSANGGKGAYAIGYKKLNKGDVIYICVGGAGSNVRHETALNRWTGGGYNGGGKSYSEGPFTYGKNGPGQVISAPGGGCTHFATKTGQLSALSNSTSNVLLVAGAGGGASVYTATNLKVLSPGENGGICSLAYQYGPNFGLGGYANDYDRCAGGGSGWKGGTYGSAFYNNNLAGKGGSNYTGGLPTFSYNGVSYAPSTSNGQRSGNGIAYVSLVALSKIFNLKYNDVVVNNLRFNGVEVEQLRIDGVPVYGTP